MKKTRGTHTGEVPAVSGAGRGTSLPAFIIVAAIYVWGSFTRYRFRRYRHLPPPSWVRFICMRYGEIFLGDFIGLQFVSPISAVLRKSAETSKYAVRQSRLLSNLRRFTPIASVREFGHQTALFQRTSVVLLEKLEEHVHSH